MEIKQCIVLHQLHIDLDRYEKLHTFSRLGRFLSMTTRAPSNL